MNDRTLIRRSKRLSRILRHDPAAAGLTLSEGGWVDVDALLKGMDSIGQGMTRDELEEVVATNDKKRFAFSDCGTEIRAAQGHSIDIDLKLEPSVPPAKLLHGTASRNVEIIQREGLKPMRRQHVHLSSDVETARKVGSRHGKPVVFELDASGAHASGGKFFISDNGVWLSDAVAPRWLRLIET